MADQATEQELAPQRVRELDGAQLVDVRTTEEFDAGHVPGARHLPLEQVQGRAGDLDRDKPVVFYCRSGDRSALAVDAFRASGWDAYAMAGGLVAWADEGLPLEPEDGEVAHHSGLPPA
jgi:rhodanese-related sulfurtransferase